MVKVDVRKVRNLPNADDKPKAVSGAAFTLSPALRIALKKLAANRQHANNVPQVLALDELREWMADECYPSVALSAEARAQLLDWLNHAEAWGEQRITKEAPR